MKNALKDRRLLFALSLACPATALAHARGGEALGFTTGLAHPVSGLDHVLAMIAVGLWGAQLGAPAVWLLPVTFPMVMAFGGMLGLMGVRLPGIEIGIALSAIALGGRYHRWLLRHLPRTRTRLGAAGGR
jgi:urease accessory protein